MGKKFWSYLLVICMLATLIPQSVFAVEATSENVEEKQEVTTETKESKEVKQETTEIRKIEKFSKIVSSYFVDKGTKQAEINLPSSIGVTLEGEKDSMLMPVQWKCVTEGGYKASPSKTTTYTFEPSWDETKYERKEGLSKEEVPSANVTIFVESTVKGKKAAMKQSVAAQNDSAQKIKEYSEEKGINPVTGDNDATAPAGDIFSELLIGSSNNSKQYSTSYYDWLEFSNLWEKYRSGVLTLPRKKDAYVNQDTQGERVIGVRTVAFDPLAEGQKRYTAELSAVEDNGDTVIYLNIYRVATKDGPTVMHGTYSGIARLNFVPKEWQIGAYLSIAAGDYNGDGKDELAVYCPNGAGPSGMQNDIPQINPAPAVVIMKPVKTESPDPSETEPIYRMEAIDQTKGGEEDVYYFDPYYLSKGDNHMKEDILTLNNMFFMFAADLQTVEQAGDRVDDLAIAVSGAKDWGTPNSSAAYTQVDVWRDPVKGLKWAQLDSFDMKWDLNKLDQSRFRPGTQKEQMMFGGLAAGDTDNNGDTEIVVAGYRIKNTLGTDWKIDDRWYLVQQLKYDKKKNKYLEIGNVPQGLKVEDQLSKSNISRLYTENMVMDPMAALCYKGRGSDIEDSIFIGGCVYEWNKAHGYSGPNQNKNGTVSGGYKRLFTVTPFGAMTTKIDKENFPAQQFYRDTFENKVSSSKRWYSQPTAGIFNDNALGIEQLFCLYTMDCGDDGSVSEVIIATAEDPATKDYKESFSDTKPCYKNVTIRSNLLQSGFWRKNSSHARTLCAVDPDQDVGLANHKSTEVYYADPVPVSVLQASPYHEELGELGTMNYGTAGSTTFASSKSSGTSTENSFSTTIGVIIGAEVKTSFFGLAETGIEASTEIYGGAGYQNITTSSITSKSGFTGVGDDMVVAMVTPYVRYRYNTIATGMEMTTERLREAKTQINQLKSQIDTYPASERASYEQKIETLEAQVAEWKREIALASGGTVTDDGTIETSFSIPGEPTITMMSRENYNKITGMKEEMITDQMLRNTVAGDVGSYVTSSSNMPKGLQLYHQQMLISNAKDPSFVSQEVAMEKTDENATTWEAGIDSSLIVSAGGIKAGTALDVNYSGSVATIQATGTDVGGTVASIPEDADESYGFNYRLGWWQQMIGVNRCNFVGHFVTPIGNNKFPPKPVEGLTVEPKLEGGTYEGAIISWDKPTDRKYNLMPNKYEVYIDGFKKSIQTTSTDTKVSCEISKEIMWSDQVHQVKVFAVAGESSSEVKSIESETVNFFYLSEEKRDAYIVKHPEDVTLESETLDEDGNEIVNHDIAFATEVDISDTNISYDTENWEWQKQEPGGVWTTITKEEPGYKLSKTPDTVKKIMKFTLGLTVGDNDVGTKYRARMPIGVDANNDANIDRNDPKEYFYMTSKEVELKSNKQPNVDLSISVEKFQLVVDADANQGSGMIKVELINLTNSGQSISKQMLYTSSDSKASDEIVKNKNSVSLGSGIYQAIGNLSDGTKVYSDPILYKSKDGNDASYLALNTELQEGALKSARGVTRESSVKNTERMEFGKSLSLSTKRYENGGNTEDVSDIEYMVLDSAGEDITNKCISGTTFTPPYTGIFTIMAKDVATKKAAVRMIQVVQNANAPYEQEAFKDVVDTLDDIEGLHYQTPAKYLGLPKTVKIASSTGAIYDATVTWDTSAYQENLAQDQTFTANGTITLPSHVSGTAPKITVKVSVNNAEPFYAFKASPGEFDPPEEEATTPSPAQTGLTVPQNLKLKQTTASKIKVSWKKVDGATGYKIYRASKKNGTYKKVKTLNGASKTSWTNKKRKIGSTYYYKVRAFKTSNNKTTYSKYTAKKRLKVRPFAPKFKLKQNGLKLYVTWTRKSYASGYQIANDNKGKMKIVKTTKQKTKPKYTSKYWRHGHKYHYKMRSYKVVKGKRVYSKWSKIKTVKIK